MPDIFNVLNFKLYRYETKYRLDRQRGDIPDNG